MGQALQKAAQWTSGTDRQYQKLEFSSLNEDILGTILNFLENPEEKTQEQRKLVFKTPLVWMTSLKPVAFVGPGYTYHEKHGVVVSEATASKGDVHLLELKDNKISIWSLEQAENVLRVAGDKKRIELRTCLEENEDIVAKILGDRFASVEGADNSILRYHDEIIKEIEALAKQPEGNDEKMKVLLKKRTVLGLRLKLMQLDEKILNTCIIKFTKDLRLNPKIVDGEVKILQLVTGSDLQSSIEYIRYYGSDYVFENGCRAHPWRQMHGDICYLEVKCHDKDEALYIIANTTGYYLSAHMLSNTSTEKDYEHQDGIMYKNLVTLLKDKSQHFAEMIMKQDFSVKHQKENNFGVVVSKHKEDDDRDEHVDKTSRSEQHTRQNKDHPQEKDKKQKTQTKTKFEPSLKWKNLIVEEDQKVLTQAQNKLSQTSVLTEHHQKKLKIPQGEAEEHFSESSTESDEEEEALERRPEGNADLPTEYWQIQKLVKYLKGGNQTATIIALCSLRDFNLAQETCQLAIRDVGGLEVLINLLDTEEVKCKIGSLKILKEISHNTQIRRAIADLGGLQTMVKILRDQDKDLKCLAAETIANVAKFRRARRTVRQHGGIKRLVNLLDCVKLNSATMTPEMEMSVEVARCGALALWSCSKSKKTKSP